MSKISYKNVTCQKQICNALHHSSERPNEVKMEQLKRYQKNTFLKKGYYFLQLTIAINASTSKFNARKWDTYKQVFLHYVRKFYLKSEY